MSQEKLTELKARLLEISDLHAAADLLFWDQQTYMPEGGSAYRSRQLGTLTRIAHEKAIDPEIGTMLDELQPFGESLDYDSDEASLIRLARRQYDDNTRVPADFLAKANQHFGDTYAAWTEARPANDFARMTPYLEQTLEYSREFAQFFPHDHIADPLIDVSDYGMKAESIRTIFAELREALVPLVQAITSQDAPDDSFLHQSFPVDQQLTFGLGIGEQFGYDLSRGRQDLTHHPFEVKISTGDVRITTRTKEDDLTEALFSTLHETGHALYEQGCAADLDGTPLNQGTSSGVHESQSRLWENVIGRSRAFWEHYYKALQAEFPEHLGDVSLDSFYRAINKVQRSLIRTDADEVTYNLHVMIRFDLELQMLEGSLAVKDLRDAWNARYKSDLGIEPPEDKDGVLQDVHWYAGFIGGAFQGYTLGNIMCLQFYDASLKAQPNIPADIRHGKFDTLHNWLKDSIYQHGSKFTADELLNRVTGRSLTIEPYIKYLRAKFGELYTL